MLLYDLQWCEVEWNVVENNFAATQWQNNNNNSKTREGWPAAAATAARQQALDGALAPQAGAGCQTVVTLTPREPHLYISYTYFKTILNFKIVI